MFVDKLHLQKLAIVGQKRIAFSVCALLLITNFLLVMKIYSMEEKIIITPVNMKDSFWVTNSKVSEGYLDQMIPYFTHYLLNIHYENFEFHVSFLMQHADAYYMRDIFYSIQKLKETYTRLRMDTVFYPENIIINDKDLTAVISGKFIAFVSDRKVIEENRKYLITFSYLAGALRLKSFNKLDENNQPETTNQIDSLGNNQPRG
ncbi:MAG: hypothetical protein J0H68_09420 [Sphingobacteriia bacterium]|nr:hypothetical protein [Sphingobacteriia bacterium]